MTETNHFPTKEKRVLTSPVVSDVDPKYMPPGAYRGKCTDIFEDTSKGGNKMWVWDFTITEGPHAGKDLRMWTALTDSAMWKLNDVMQGLMIEKDPKSMQYKLDIDAVLSWSLVIVVEDNEYNGQTKSSVAAVYHEKHENAPEVESASPEAYDPGAYDPGNGDASDAPPF